MSVEVGVEVDVVRSASPEVVAAFGRLLPQLPSSLRPLDRETVKRIVGCETGTVLVARSGGEIVGTLTLVLLPLASGPRGRVGDVVVDGAARGQRVAALLTGHAVRLAREAGARSVDLTSRPERGAANRLYERLGFAARRSTVYRFAVGEQGQRAPAGGCRRGASARGVLGSRGLLGSRGGGGGRRQRPRGSGEGNGPSR
ncbi:GNAT family N-acetyltransferase [Streptomyces sp. NBC_00669]|uniref:GNAT family N-acetyltransferase n=1 Tax=Streptomyces sp. NBC_00669 TaxID=2976011 RepID=UPI002E355EE7|nr:GNAT family N-acetyltransferase [Streptomyces sp. NBC_00669]